MPEITKSKHLTTASWDDVPHLDEKTKSELMESTPPHLRDARAKGIPSLGSGAIYPIPESEIVCEPFPIPPHWPVGYGMDVGWNKTAGVWLAWDRESDVLYAWSEHYRGQAEPAVHAHAIMSRANWIPGFIDPASAGSNQKDGTVLMDIYRDLELSLQPANNAVEAGIWEVYERLSTSRLKIFNTLRNTLAEYRLYRRDDKGKIVKEFDHALDALRYGVMSCGLFITKPIYHDDVDRNMSRNKRTGY